MDFFQVELQNPLLSGHGSNGRLDNLASIVTGHGLWWLRASHFIGTKYEHTGERMMTALARMYTSDGREGLASGLNKVMSELEVQPEESLLDHNTMDSIRLSIIHVQMFTTPNEYLGLALITTRHEDMVLVFPGAIAPFVLRPVENNTYRPIGYRYVYGMVG